MSGGSIGSRWYVEKFLGTDKGSPTKLKNPMILGVESDQCYTRAESL